MYYLVYGLFYLISLLPLRILYLLSDFTYFIIYYVTGYRKEIVFQNLSVAFPEKSDQEKKEIAKKFYRNFTDNFIETIKLISAGENFINKHYSINVEVLDKLYEQNKKCQAHLGHNFNWELANNGMALLTPFKFLSVYMPITNKVIDRLFIKLRTKTGAVMLPATEMRTAMLPYRDQKYLLALVADQNPGVPSKAYWFNFFGRPTPFVKGPEKAARANDCAVLFAHIIKTKRGHYVAHLDLATTEPRILPQAELTKMYVQYLERVIKANPEMWLWTHRRWKHQWKPEYGDIIA